MTRIYCNNKGFSLIELAIAMAISTIVMAAVYSAYRNQLGTYVTQQTIVDMQQNARAGMFLMEREVRLAGYDPTLKAGAGIEAGSNRNTITFTMDLNQDGDVADAGEQIEYAINGDDLGRNDVNSGGGIQTAAINIDALDFVYLDEDGNTTSDASQARSVQISLVARAGDDVPVLGPKHTDKNTYRNQQGDIILNAQNDNFRRFLLTSDVKCRNLSLE